MILTVVGLSAVAPGGINNRMKFEGFLLQLGFEDTDHLSGKRSTTLELIEQYISLHTFNAKLYIEELENNQSM